jgi:hypothetical protein
MKAKALIMITAFATALVGAPAQGAVGDVISSFYMTGTSAPTALGIYRDSACVYGLVYNSGGYLWSYTTAGSYIGSVTLAGATYPRDADQIHTGTGYLGVIDGLVGRVYTVATGSLVTSTVIPVSWGFGYAAGGPYYYYGRGTTVQCYSTMGSLLNSFSVPSQGGGLAGTTAFNGLNGNYVIFAPAAAGTTYVYTNAGVMVGSFVVPGATNGCVCGAGAPTSYGTTYWANQNTGGGMYAYQVDLGSATAVVPKSLGTVKAIFR